MSAVPPDSLPRARILVVDDEAHGRLALQELLEAPDREVAVAASGEAALGLVAASDFALVLLDVRMPGMDGFETARRMRECARAERTPIIFLTGAYEDMASVMRGYAAGGVDYVVKPFAPEVLRSKVAVFVDLYYKSAELARQIMERRRAEEALSRANEQLEARIRERTERLTRANERLRKEVAMRKKVEEALREAKRAADAANFAKTEFLANMSHEIRTPMNAIVGMTELALQASPKPEIQEFLSAVKVSSASLLGIIDDVLDLSKIEAGRLTVETAPFSLRECAIDAVRTLALQAHDKGLDLVCEIEPDVPDGVVGDPLRLRQILINLVGNGIKFTARGEVVASIALEAGSEAEATLHFRVRDTGIGIPEDKQGAIFRRFLQADPSTTRLYGGSGLGLTICARLVEMMHGRIWVESRPEAGSVFHFTARFGRQAVAPARRAPAEVRDVRILLVEDHPVSRRAIAGALQAAGASVIEAESGDAALRLLRASRRARQPVHVVLLDETLPDGDSRALAKRIMRARRGADAPSVVMLGAGVRRNEAGVAALAKPVKPGELLEAVHGRMARAAPEPAPAQAARSGLRVLLVEDNALSQKLACYVLRKHGHEVMTADDGVAALEIHGRETLDVILMDVRMPRMDGLRATTAIREREKETGLHVPIIALTANAMSADREACLKSGMDECLIKPIQPAALLASIERLHRPGPARTLEPRRNAVLDEAALLERVDGDLALLDAIACAYFRDSARLMSQCRSALGRGDAESVQRTLHTLSGMFRNLSAEAAKNATERLQSCDVHSDAAGAAACLEMLEGEMRQLEATLTRLRAWQSQPRDARSGRHATHVKQAG